MTIHNLSGVLEAQELGFSRIVLAREVPISEIKKIKENCNVELEAFLHGALCISYSGQCLFSSMIGGRSGNRGKCAQACRLPYELLKDSKSIEKGYLLSPKDVCSLPILSDLINSGIDSLKIEGRMKTPEYVATVTRIYRKYIDTLQEIDSKDTTDLMQVFNRGSFSTGHLENKPNSNFIYTEKSNNQGIYLGKVLTYAPITGHVKLKLEAPLGIGDTICIASETGNYTVSELMIKKQNQKQADSGEIVTIGRMKGNIIEGAKIYKMSSKVLSDFAKISYSGKEIKKIPLNAKLIVKAGVPVELEIGSQTYLSDLIPEQANTSPITKSRIIEQLSKTGNTPYEFKKIEIDMDDNLYLPSLGKLNELRRNALEQYQKQMRSLYKREELKLESKQFCNDSNIIKNGNKVSVLLNNLSQCDDYSYLYKCDIVYIPYSCFINSPNIAKTLCDKYSVYIYLPNILKSFDKCVFDKFKIKGAVLSNIGQFNMIPANIEKFGNYTLNIFNSYTIDELKNIGITKVMASPELSKQDLENLIKSSPLPIEIFAYGNLPLMTMQYCPLTHTNHCPTNCAKLCEKGNYELKDRLGFRFKIRRDNTQETTTLYNSKITSIALDDLSCDSICVSFLDESEEKRKNVLDVITSGKRLEGENYTNGNMLRDV